MRRVDPITYTTGTHNTYHESSKKAALSSRHVDIMLAAGHTDAEQIALAHGADEITLPISREIRGPVGENTASEPRLTEAENIES